MLSVSLLFLIATATPALLLLGTLLVIPAVLAVLVFTAGGVAVRALGFRRPRPSPPLSAAPSTLPAPVARAEAHATGALNAAIAALWPTLTTTIQVTGASALAAALPPLPPPLSWALSRIRLHLAGPAPRLESFLVTSPAAEAGGGPGLAAEASVSWQGGLEVGLELLNSGGAARRPALRVGALVDGLSGAVRAEVLSFSPSPTPSCTLRLSLPRPPDLALSSWVGSPLGAGFLPFLDAFLEGALRESVCGPLLAPGGGVELSWPPGAAPAASSRGKGVVVVDLEAGLDLPASPVVVAIVSVPGGRAVGGGGTAAVAGRGLSFSTSPPAVFLIAPDARGLRVRVSLYGMASSTPVFLGTGEVEVGEAENEAAALIPLSKAGGAPLTPRTARATVGAVIPRARLRARITVGRPAIGEVATTTTTPSPASPGGDWLRGGVLRVGLGHPPPPAPGTPRLSLARLVDVSAGGRTARLEEGKAADIALPASALTSPGASLGVSAWDWEWATAADAPLSFTRPAPGRLGPARLAVPLPRLVGAPGGHTAGVFRLSGAPDGSRAAVALEARWLAFRAAG